MISFFDYSCTVLYYLLWGVRRRPVVESLLNQLECDFQRLQQGERCSLGAVPTASPFHLLPHRSQLKDVPSLGLLFIFPHCVITEEPRADGAL